MLDQKALLIISETGSFAKAFTRIVLEKYRPKKIIIFGLDGIKQQDMKRYFNERHYPFIKYFAGEITDKAKVYKAFYGIDCIIHAALLEQTHTPQYDYSKTIEKDIVGAQNVIDAAIDRGVNRVVFISTENAVNPINLYGATKLCAERLFITANSYARGMTRFSVVRCSASNLWGAIEEVANFIFCCLEKMRGGETFIQKLPSMVLISKDESKRAIDVGNFFVIQPDFPLWYLKSSDGANLA